jgi:hypothetical protein
MINCALNFVNTKNFILSFVGTAVRVGCGHLSNRPKKNLRYPKNQNDVKVALYISKTFNYKAISFSAIYNALILLIFFTHI